MKDYYAILGLPRTATAAEIDAAFRSLAMQCHPDRRPEEEEQGATAEFKLATEAHETLSDAAKRREYDRAMRSKWRQQTAGRTTANRFAKSPRAGGSLHAQLDVDCDLPLVPEEASAGGPIDVLDFAARTVPPLPAAP